MAMHQLTTSDRRKRLMRRIHTFQSEDQSTHGSEFELDFPSVHYDDDDDNASDITSQQVNRNLLFVPDIHELKLDEGEKPPHKRDVIEKIPMRVRSQSWLIRTRHLLHEEREPPPLISHMMLIFSSVFFVMSFPWSLFFCIKIIKYVNDEPARSQALREYQRAVIFRLGRLIKGGTKGPGLFFILPCIDTCKIVSFTIIHVNYHLFLSSCSGF
ncbi:hypothetical protein ANCCAN_03782 [Ancylostoma caninum]|uniref:Band 7 domain-containing protein n=1 Tax=Ancylostoma caninum TaxID=29170 RepID=A0A368H4J9_ANCCA|nr:hypothetical protein ANCCAN_03782 [Ancylostoma caninum]